MTSDTDKIDAALRAVMERLERAAQAGEAIAVVIEPAARKADDAATRAALDHIRARLEEMKAKEPRQLALASAIVARLTAGQIRLLADDDQVRRIFMDAPEKVTLA